MVTHADFLGAPGILVFFPKAFTVGCRTELRAFQLALEAFRDCGARVAGVSADTWFENRRFAIAERLEFPLLSDWPHRSTLSTLGLDDGTGRARRVTLVFDADQIIRGVISNVEASTHASRALALIRGLADGGTARGAGYAIADHAD